MCTRLLSLGLPLCWSNFKVYVSRYILWDQNVICTGICKMARLWCVKSNHANVVTEAVKGFKMLTKVLKCWLGRLKEPSFLHEHVLRRIQSEFHLCNFVFNCKFTFTKYFLNIYGMNNIFIALKIYFCCAHFKELRVESFVYFKLLSLFWFAVLIHEYKLGNLGSVGPLCREQNRCTERMLFFYL